jgi:hypothetical protein
MVQRAATGAHTRLPRILGNVPMMHSRLPPHARKRALQRERDALRERQPPRVTRSTDRRRLGPPRARLSHRDGKASLVEVGGKADIARVLDRPNLLDPRRLAVPAFLPPFLPPPPPHPHPLCSRPLALMLTAVSVSCSTS